MSSFLKFTGAVMALFAALFFAREYAAFIKRRTGLCQGFLKMLEHIRFKIDCFLTPEGELLLDFDDPALSECGYLPLAREIGVNSAYAECESSLSLPEKVKSLLSPFFSDFGREYREGTLRQIDSAISQLRSYITQMQQENERSVKLVYTVSAAAALGIVILLI